MSYRCQKCGVQVQAGQDAIKVVTKVRPVEYVKVIRDKHGRETPVDYFDGKEIAQELMVCTACAEGVDTPEVEELKQVIVN